MPDTMEARMRGTAIAFNIFRNNSPGKPNSTIVSDLGAGGSRLKNHPRLMPPNAPAIVAHSNRRSRRRCRSASTEEGDGDVSSRWRVGVDCDELMKEERSPEAVKSTSSSGVVREAGRRRGTSVDDAEGII